MRYVSSGFPLIKHCSHNRNPSQYPNNPTECLHNHFPLFIHSVSHSFIPSPSNHPSISDMRISAVCVASTSTAISRPKRKKETILKLQRKMEKCLFSYFFFFFLVSKKRKNLFFCVNTEETMEEIRHKCKDLTDFYHFPLNRK